MTEFVTGMAKGESGEEAALKAVKQAKENLNDQNINFSVVFSSTEYNYHEVLETVERETGNSKIIGCTTAGEFTEKGPQMGSVAVGLVSGDDIKFFSGVGDGLGQDALTALKKAAENLPEQVDGFPYKSVLNLHDGLAGKGTQVTWNTIETVGQDAKVAGGSAGDDLQLQETCVFKGNECFTNSVALGMLATKDPVVLTVDHGHEPISPPITVTKSDGSTVYEFDDRPAFDVWKEQIRGNAEENLGINVDHIEPGSDELSNLMTRYGIGIQSSEGFKVRWPGLTSETDGPLQFACDLPEGSVIRIMASPKDKQIEAARRAARNAVEKMGDREVAGALVFECIVRATILDDKFRESVKAISEEINAPLLGFESYGEVCIERGEMSGFHNTTTVVMLLPK